MVVNFDVRNHTFIYEFWTVLCCRSSFRCYYLSAFSKFPHILFELHVILD